MKNPYRLWKRNNGKYYYLIPGKTWKSTGQTSKAAAHNFVLAFLRNSEKFTEGSLLTFREFLEPYFTKDCPHVSKLKSEGKSIGDNHITHSRYMLEKYVFQDEICKIPVSHLKRGHLTDFRNRLCAKAGSRTVNKVFSAIKTAIKEGVYREELLKDPTAGIGQIVYKKRKVGIFTVSELKLLFPVNDLGPWRTRMEKCCFYVAATTGMRRSEVLALQWKNIDISDFGKSFIYVSEAFKDNRSTVGLPKWNKKRVTPIPGLVAGELKMLKATAEKEFIFCYVDGSRLGNTWWQKSFNRAVDKLEIERKERGLRPHSLRHTLNTILMDQGVDRAKIRDSLGWGNEIIQDNYTHFQPEHLQIQSETIQKVLG